MVDKFKALVQYVSWRCRAEPYKLGAIKLNKILWFADCEAYRRRGRSITGARYVKEAKGPVPLAIAPTVAALRKAGLLEVSEDTYYGHRQRRFVAQAEPDMSEFAHEELKIVDEVIREITERHTANSISNLTHDDIWKIAELGEEIPLHATLVARLDRPNQEDVSRALTRMRQAA